MEPLISVIVPVYNSEKFLCQCIESITNQTYKNLEIVLVDDGSQDNSSLICDKYAKVDNRIKVIHKKNGGPSDARNTGIVSSSGEYITFVDSDDYILPEMIHTLLSLCLKYSVKLSMCEQIRCTEDGDIPANIPSEIESTLYHGIDIQEFLFKNDIFYISPCSKLYHKSIFEEIRYPSGIHLGEDRYIACKIYHAAQHIVKTTKKEYIYRINSNSIMHETFSIKQIQRVYAYEEQASFLRTHYPALERRANALLISACNVCIMEMGKHHFSDSKTDTKIKQFYKKYLIDYLLVPGTIHAKIYAIIARVNYNFLKWFIGRCNNK